VIEDNSLTNNLSYYGGGINCIAGIAIIKNNVISNNTANYGGGGVYSSGSYAGTKLIDNNIIKNTTYGSGGGGGGVCCAQESKIEINNNTIWENISFAPYGGGGGLYCMGATPNVKNTIMWGNQAQNGKEIYIRYDLTQSVVNIGYSNVEGGQSSVYVESGCTLNWGAGMIDDDPLFSDSVNDDFHLTWNSPCRDTGDNSAVTETEDFEGDPRIVFGSVDMGADEFYYHLYHTGDVVPGGNIDIKVVGYPLAPVELAWGQTVLDPPFLTQHGDLHLWPFMWSGFMGNVPSNGILEMPVTIPLSWSTGDFAPLQALVGPWGGACSKLTNLNTVTVE